MIDVKAISGPQLIKICSNIQASDTNTNTETYNMKSTKTNQIKIKQQQYRYLKKNNLKTFIRRRYWSSTIEKKISKMQSKIVEITWKKRRKILRKKLQNYI